MNRSPLTVLGLLAGCAWGMALAKRQRTRRFSFKGRTVVITGGGRGLGLVLARQLAGQGARLALLARDSGELGRAEQQVRKAGAEVLAVPCDVRRQEQVKAAVEKIVARFGSVDVLINNAGVIQVGPLEHMTVQDFEDALAIHLFAPLFCTLAVLPHMRQTGQGRIVNISSVGGKIAVPHLVPYCASKFALVGLSEGLGAELRRQNILVTTVCPGLMRTGSPRNASFKGRHRREYAWFVLADSLPFLSINAERAARQIITACRRGRARVVLGWHTRTAVLLNEIFPELAASVVDLVHRLLPGEAPGQGSKMFAGFESQNPLAPAWLTHLTEEAAAQNNEKLA